MHVKKHKYDKAVISYNILLILFLDKADKETISLYFTLPLVIYDCKAVNKYLALQQTCEPCTIFLPKMARSWEVERTPMAPNRWVKFV